MNIRVPVDLPVTISYAVNGDGPRHMRTTTRNLSFDGALLEAGEQPPEEGRLVRMELPASAAGSIAIDALVLRHDGGGLALVFAHYGEAVFERLAGLLEPELERRFGGHRR